MKAYPAEQKATGPRALARGPVMSRTQSRGYMFFNALSRVRVCRSLPPASTCLS
jgi:hypothetical protein